MKGGVFILVLVILSFNLISAEGAAEDMELNDIINGRGRYVESAIDCDHLRFRAPQIIPEPSYYLNKTDCELIEHEEIVESYLMDLLDYEEECWRQAERINDNFERYAQELLEEIDNQEEIPPIERERRSGATAIEYEVMSVLIATAVVSIVESLEGDFESKVESVVGPTLRGNYSYNIQERLNKITVRAEKSCREAEMVGSRLYNMCRLSNAKIRDQGGLSREDKTRARGVMEDILNSSQQKYNNARIKHGEFERNSWHIEDWFMNPMEGVPTILITMRENCDKLKMVRMMTQIYAKRIAKTNETELSDSFRRAQERMKNKSLSGALGSLFGNEKINIYVLNESENEIKLNLLTNKKKVKKFKMGHLDDPTLNLYMDISTMGEIIDSENPSYTLQDSVKKRKITYKGVGFGKRVKFGVAGFFGRLFGFA